MKLHRVRPACRAPNCFSPSALLYQNFVSPFYATCQQRSSSSAPAHQATENEPPNDSTQVLRSPLLSTEVESPQRLPAETKIRFSNKNNNSNITKKDTSLTDRKKAWGPASKTFDGDLNRSRSLAFMSEANIKKLLSKARLACEGGEEYDATSIRPYLAEAFVPEQKWPWSAKTAQSNLHALSRLNREINDFYEYAKPTRAEAFARKNLIAQICADVQAHLPDHSLEVFGSERTGMALALSDIDLRLVKRNDLDQQTSDMPPAPDQRREIIRSLYELRHNVFAGTRNVSAAKYISPVLRHARYPLISVQDRGSGLDVQVVGANDTAKQREIIQRYMKQYPFLRQLYAVIKTMFEQRGLSEVFQGGFGSYTLLIMIVASLQNQPNTRGDAAGALVNFLYYWAYFKTKEKGVSVSPREYFDKKKNPVLTDATRAKINAGKRKPLPDYLLSLRDPADETNDLGRKAVSILHAQATLRALTANLLKNLNANVRPSLLAEIVGNVYARDRTRRERLVEHGLWVQEQVQKSLAAAKQAPSPSPSPSPPQTDTAPSVPQEEGKEEEEGDIHGFLEVDASNDSVASASKVQPASPDATLEK